jgi:hypothetical protein
MFHKSSVCSQYFSTFWLTVDSDTYITTVSQCHRGVSCFFAFVFIQFIQQDDKYPRDEFYNGQIVKIDMDNLSGSGCVFVPSSDTAPQSSNEKHRQIRELRALAKYNSHLVTKTLKCTVLMVC